MFSLILCLLLRTNFTEQSISSAQLRTVRGCSFLRKFLHRCCVRNHRFRQHRIDVPSYCDVAQIFDLVRNIYVKTSNEPSARIRHVGELIRLTAPSGNPTKPSEWALLAQFVQSVLFYVHPKGGVSK